MRTSIRDDNAHVKPGVVAVVFFSRAQQSSAPLDEASPSCAASAAELGTTREHDIARNRKTACRISEFSWYLQGYDSQKLTAPEGFPARSPSAVLAGPSGA